MCWGVKPCAKVQSPYPASVRGPTCSKHNSFLYFFSLPRQNANSIPQRSSMLANNYKTDLVVWEWNASRNCSFPIRPSWLEIGGVSNDVVGFKTRDLNALDAQRWKWFQWNYELKMGRTNSSWDWENWICQRNQLSGYDVACVESKKRHHWNVTP